MVFSFFCLCGVFNCCCVCVFLYMLLCCVVLMCCVSVMLKVWFDYDKFLVMVVVMGVKFKV